MRIDLAGQTIGAYRIIEQIGQGGMAVVYKAYEPALDRYVAIKVLPEYFAHDPDFVARFEREAKAIAKLDHPNIIKPINFLRFDDKNEGWIIFPRHSSGIEVIRKCAFDHANLALGCKLLWQIHAEPSHPISQIFTLKYLKNQSIKTFNMEKPPKGTQA